VATSTSTEAEIWERIIHPRGRMTKGAARRIQGLTFTEQEIARVRELAERNRQGRLSDDEDAELDHYLRVGTPLTVLKLRARRVLRETGRTS